jgi:opacity protein-like surface antigen
MGCVNFVDRFSITPQIGCTSTSMKHYNENVDLQNQFYDTLAVGSGKIGKLKGGASYSAKLGFHFSSGFSVFVGIGYLSVSTKNDISVPSSFPEDDIHARFNIKNKVFPLTFQLQYTHPLVKNKLSGTAFGEISNNYVRYNLSLDRSSTYWSDTEIKAKKNQIGYLFGAGLDYEIVSQLHIVLNLEYRILNVEQLKMEDGEILKSFTFTETGSSDAEQAILDFSGIGFNLGFRFFLK